MYFLLNRSNVQETGHGFDSLNFDLLALGVSFWTGVICGLSFLGTLALALLKKGTDIITLVLSGIAVIWIVLFYLSITNPNG